MKAKLSLSESVELVPRRVTNNNTVKIYVVSIIASKSNVLYF